MGLMGILLIFISTIIAQNEKSIIIDPNAEVRKSGNFTAIELSGAIDLFLSQGIEEAIAVSASDADYKARIKTEIKGNTLHIYLNSKGLSWKIWGNHKLKAYVTFKNLTKVESSGASNIRIMEGLKGDDFSLELSGASDLSGQVSVNTLRLSTSGASNIKISGSAEKAQLFASGACNIKGYDLKVNTGKVEASGASAISLFIIKEIDAEASGFSNILLKGPGIIKNISSSGGASIKHKSD